jgi:hypothetical protein
LDVSKANPVRAVVYWATKAEGLAQAELSARTAKQVQEAIVYLYTDRSAPPQLWADVTVRMPFGERPLMVENLVAQAHFMLRHMPVLDCPVAFLDSDTLIAHELRMPPAVDLAVTYRDHVARDKDGNKVAGVAELMPYNYGVILANPTMAATEAILALRERVAKLSRNYQDWYGNQVALRELVGLDKTKRMPYVVRRKTPWADILVSVLDADVWNYTPEAAGEPIEGRKVLHLKGRRKHLMQHYLDRILAEAEL